MKPLTDETVKRLQRLVEMPDFLNERYEVGEEIGKGGMGSVYRARDTYLGRDVAIKVPQAGLETEDAVSRLQQEARVLARLEHPGVVPVHDAGRLPDGRVYYTMKLVEGERLDHYCEKRRPLPELLRIFVRITDAVAFAHSSGVIHRDLKPQNIMTGKFGEVLVLDWGAAKILAHLDPPAASKVTAKAETAYGAVIGTEGYMAPEQADGKSGQADARSDVYSLGRLLCTMICSALAPSEIPRPLRAISDKACAFDREARYEDAGEVGAEVSRFLNGESVLAYRERWWEQVGRWLGRHRLWVALIVTYLAARALLIFFGRR